jgi:hypothetical protein
MRDRFDLTTIAVGHGDAILGHWQPSAGKSFTFLVDGGPRLNARPVHQALAERGIASLDLVVLSHVDADHVDGLLDIASAYPVTTYWGPCLPAFERHSWLFADRVRVGLDKARTLEHLLRGRGTTILCPQEGFSDRSADGCVEVQVLNPPSRLYERLLVQEDGVELFLSSPTPMGWLLETHEIVDEPRQQSAIRTFLREHRAFDPGDLPSLPARPPIPAAERDEAIRKYASDTGNDPEFFGNNCLNDTSLVLWVEVLLEQRFRRTLLLTGDLENWLYVLSRHPRGMMVDVLKAPHHGGRVYVGENIPSYDAVFQMLRPAATVVSARGLHSLPRSDFRETISRWSRSLFCPCTRGREIVVGDVVGEKSCHDVYGCSKEQRSVTISLQADTIEGDAPACTKTPGAEGVPVIQIRQHVVDPSPVIDRLVEGELRRHVKWIVKQLEQIHAERRRNWSSIQDPPLPPVTFEQLATLARNDGRHALANRDLQRVLIEGWRGHEFWSDASEHRYNTKDIAAYALPSKDDVRSIGDWLRSFLLIALKVGGDPQRIDRGAVFASADTSSLAEEVARKFTFPAEMFREAIWPSAQLELRRMTAFAYESSTLILTSCGSESELEARLGKVRPERGRVSNETAPEDLREAGILLSGIRYLLRDNNYASTERSLGLSYGVLREAKLLR